MSPYGAVGYGQAPGPGYQTTSNTAYYGGTGGYYAGDPMQAAYAAGTSASTYSSSPYRAGSSAAMQPRGTTTAHDPYRQASHQQAVSGGTANVAPGGSSQYAGGGSMDRGMYYSTSGSESAPESARRQRRSSAAVPDHYQSGHHPQTAYSGTGNYASGSTRASTSASGVAGAGVYGTAAPAGQAVATHERTYRGPSARDTYTTPTAEGSPMTHDQARNFLEEFYAANDGNKRPGPEQRATLAGITGLNIDYVANW